mgnify:CR=1 FL=1
MVKFINERLKQKEQQHSVLNIKELMVNVEDVENQHITIKRKDVHHVDSQMPK